MFIVNTNLGTEELQNFCNDRGESKKNIEVISEQRHAIHTTRNYSHINKIKFFYVEQDRNFYVFH